MLNTCRHFNPAMHAFFIHREGGRGKGWICERSHGDDDAVFATLANVVHRGAAGGAEVECGPAAAIADPNEGVRCPGDGHRACRKSRLRREHAAGPALAGQAVANGNADRLGRRDGRELAARATGCSGGHIELCRFLGRHIIYIQFQHLWTSRRQPNGDLAGLFAQACCRLLHRILSTVAACKPIPSLDCQPPPSAANSNTQFCNLCPCTRTRFMLAWA